jgi:hypothetical protein
MNVAAAPAMLARFAADSVLLLHLCFILFVVLGGLLVVRWHALMLVHVAAVAWAVFVEATGTICPLTFAENRLLDAANLSGYGGSFVEHYLLGMIYPAGLTRPGQYLLAILVVAVNATIYITLLRSLRER